jgi:phage terminase large subunit GpA-like protein
MTALAALSRDLALAARRRGLMPEPPLTVSAWADRHRILPLGTARPGPWRTATVPYLAAPMDALSPASPVERVVVSKAAQVGATELSLNALACWIEHAPGPILSVLPSIEMARRFSRSRLEPLIASTPALSRLIAPARTRDAGNTITSKEFPGGVLQLAGANAPAGLRSMAARYLICDEVDSFPADVGEEGDPVALAIARTTTFAGRRKIALISTPTIAGVSRIEKAYGESDQRRFFCPCPQCGDGFVWTWAHVVWPADDPGRAHIVCPSCGGITEARDKARVVAAGQWKATADGDGRTAGFHISGLVSSFTTWADMARDFLASKRDVERLKAWTNLALGEAFEDRDTAPVEADALIGRAEDSATPWADLLPDGVALVTAGVDVQDDRLEAEFVGWGLREESWSIDYRVIAGDTSRPDVWEALDRLLLRRFRHPRAVADLPVSAACLDSGGHRTGEVLAFAGPRANRRVWPIKGRGGPGVPPWPRRPPKIARGRVAPVHIVGVDAVKGTLAARLRLADTQGPGIIHMPAERDREWFLQMTAEKAIRQYRKGVARIEWIHEKNVRNEAFDCRVYAMAALYGLRAAGIDLDTVAKSIRDKPMRSADGPATVPGSRSATSRSKWMGA